MFTLVKKLTIIFIIFFYCFGFTGCWDRNEVEDISIVLGVLVDTAPGEKVSLEVQVLNPSAIAGGGGGSDGGGGGGKPWRNYAASADTLFLAGREIARQASRQLYFAQNQVIVFSERIARERGLAEIIDFFERNPQFRRTNWVFIFKGDEPRRLFEEPSILQRTPVRRIATSAQKSGQVADFVSVRLGELLNMIATEGMQPTIGGIEVIPNKAYVETDIKNVLGTGTEKYNLSLDGNGVFKNEKLVGWLESSENRGFLWIINRIEGGVIEVPFGEEGDKIALEIIRSNTDLEPVIRDGSIIMKLKVKTLASIVECETDENYSKPEVVNALSRQTEIKIAEDIRNALERVQGDYRSDIFGFGHALSKEYNKQWKQVKDRWDDEVFPTVQVELQVDVIIRGSGLVSMGVHCRE